MQTLLMVLKQALSVFLFLIYNFILGWNMTWDSSWQISHLTDDISLGTM